MLLSRFKVLGKSMEPLICEGQSLLVSFLPYFFRKPKAGEIIVLRSPKDKRYVVKRIQKIEKDRYFVVGDNKDKSTDSREFGLITKKDIVGKVIYYVSFVS